MGMEPTAILAYGLVLPEAELTAAMAETRKRFEVLHGFEPLTLSLELLHELVYAGATGREPVAYANHREDPEGHRLFERARDLMDDWCVLNPVADTEWLGDYATNIVLTDEDTVLRAESDHAADPVAHMAKYRPQEATIALAIANTLKALEYEPKNQTPSWVLLARAI